MHNVAPASVNLDVFYMIFLCIQMVNIINRGGKNVFNPELINGV